MCCSGVLKGVLCTRCNRPALLCAVRLSSRLTLSTHLPDTLPPSIHTSASTHMQDPQRDGRLTADGGAALTVITIPLGPSPCLPPADRTLFCIRKVIRKGACASAIRAKTKTHAGLLLFHEVPACLPRLRN